MHYLCDTDNGTVCSTWNDLQRLLKVISRGRWNCRTRKCSTWIWRTVPVTTICLKAITQAYNHKSKSVLSICLRFIGIFRTMLATMTTMNRNSSRTQRRRNDDILLHLVQQGRAAAPPSPLLVVPNVTAHPSSASVPTSYYSMWHYKPVPIKRLSACSPFALASL